MSMPGARIIDRTGRKMLPIGDDGFETAAAQSVLIDKTMLIADVLNSGYKATLFCRPRRFGKTLNITMLKAFFEVPPDGVSRAPLFEGSEIWEADGGHYREHQGAYPVVMFSFNTIKKQTWDEAYGALRLLIADEYERHAYVLEGDLLSESERAYFERVRAGEGDRADYEASLTTLCRYLYRYHKTRVVVLIDEYDAPVMAGYSAPNGGYYADVVAFLKGWLTGALKDGGAALAFACLTGVQRISKESIFSDLNNLVVSTALSSDFDERYGFTDDEVSALAGYLGYPGCMEDAREWYDGYRFGDTRVFNPWSVLNYFKQGCAADVYWGNTSSNSVLGDLLRHADDVTLADVYRLMEPGGVVAAPLDLGIVFPDIGIKHDAVWSMLYLAGYLTTDLTALPGNTMAKRPLRIPNQEVARLYRAEVVQRFTLEAGGADRLDALHTALLQGDEPVLADALRAVLRDSADFSDLTSENSYHMLMLGLCFGMAGYHDPRSNGSGGDGRYDLRLTPVARFTDPLEEFNAPAVRPLVTIELKFLAKDRAPREEAAFESALQARAREGLDQIARNHYDEGDLPQGSAGRVRWGIAFCRKHVAVACEKLG